MSLDTGDLCRRVAEHARHASHTVPGALCWCRGTFTVADLKSWAGRKMRSPGFSLVDPANTNLAWPSGARSLIISARSPSPPTPRLATARKTVRLMKRAKCPDRPKVVLL